MTIVAVDGGREIVLRRLHGVRPDLDLLDSLAALRLAARRVGIDLGLRDPCPTLARVIDLTGLGEALGLDATSDASGDGSPAP